MNKKIISLIIIAILVISSIFVYVFYSNEAENDNNDVEDNTNPADNTENPPLGNMSYFDDEVNDFAFNLFGQIAEDPKNSGNLFYSPYSVFTALAMTYEGAKGSTSTEMENVLQIQQDNESFHEYVQNLYNYLNENTEFTISTANAIWPRIGYTLLDSYINIITEYYKGKIEDLDYSNAAQAAARINQWVENQTNNLIKDLIPEDAINALTMLILTNAIYFKGTWKVQFEEQNTTEEDFTTTDDETLQVQTMKMIDTEEQFNYTDTSIMKVLELEYAGDDLSMIIMLPKEGKGVSDIIDTLDRQTYSDLLDSLSENNVDIYLPKFTFKTSYTLNDYLKELGMSSAFNMNTADFSGINGIRELYISKVLHKAHVEVNEEGTEAAAATAIIMERLSIDDPDEPERIEFRADHPFLFTIHHKPTDTILFMGTVENPSL